MNLEDEEALRRKWNAQRQTDWRLLKLFGLLATACGLGMRFLPDPWQWRALYAGLAIVIIGSLVDTLWVGPRQLIRIWQIGSQKAAILKQMQEEKEDPEADGQTDE
jgi:TM2 domain-containing membrane protein YozV